MMVSAYPYWWLGLPLLLLPWWWHRQKRQRLDAEVLATAKFLPAAAPEQLRVWQWRDRLLLLLRCLLLIALLAWLAASIFPWRADTVLLDPQADPVWAQQQIASAGMQDATRIALPLQPLRWLREHEREWQPSARLLIVARAQQLAMPAHLPAFAHSVAVRLQATPANLASLPVPAALEVVLAAAPERLARWQAMLAAYARAGDAQQRYRLVDTPGPATALIIWDQATPPPADWRAPHWWLGTQQRLPGKTSAITLHFNGLTLNYADAPQGRLWTSDAFPPRDADVAQALYESWQQLQPALAQAYPMLSQDLPRLQARAASGAASPAAWLAYALLALFALERILSHARRN